MLSSEYLTDRTCKMKQYLNDMLIIINQIILAIVRTFLISSKYLKDRSCKMKQYLNYILMIINQNILAILWTFLNLKKKMKLYTKWTSTAATTEFVWKIPNRKKISYEHFNLCEAEISLDEIIKSINSETNKPPYNDCLTAEFYKHFSHELALVLLDVYDS